MPKISKNDHTSLSNGLAVAFWHAWKAVFHVFKPIINHENSRKSYKQSGSSSHFLLCFLRTRVMPLPVMVAGSTS
ncbi:MAG: hypothetical protein K2W33_16120, partial [Burkholderiales bacterium]|nr:hypothetical protein [Burkholderiales bacterium]